MKWSDARCAWDVADSECEPASSWSFGGSSLFKSGGSWKKFQSSLLSFKTRALGGSSQSWSCGWAEVGQVLGWMKADHGGTCRLIVRWVNEVMKLSFLYCSEEPVCCTSPVNFIFAQLLFSVWVLWSLMVHGKIAVYKYLLRKGKNSLEFWGFFHWCNGSGCMVCIIQYKQNVL